MRKNDKRMLTECYLVHKICIDNFYTRRRYELVVLCESGDSHIFQHLHFFSNSRYCGFWIVPSIQYT